MIFASQPELDWSELFGNEHAVEIEIGCGKGAFLVEYARRNPRHNLFGLENQPRWVRWIEARLARAPLANTRVLCADAALVTSRFVRDASVEAYHVYFPDPWWKRRHHKRRLVSTDLGAQLFRTLRRGGVLHLATDVAERFDEMGEALCAAPFVVAREPEPTPAGRPLTNFERKYRREGRALYYATFTKP
ncbi:MAG TPA: tRNA (guanosine(46)-N7)-methyltransferase TrmB [Candidatus Binatia bacterium]|nr:tRNA (guanosine(46)-N7)-methyltransferase TrmB [Candidatus Binatia bacterium]